MFNLFNTKEIICRSLNITKYITYIINVFVNYNSLLNIIILNAEQKVFMSPLPINVLYRLFLLMINSYEHIGK